jgi:hypothetical protein
MFLMMISWLLINLKLSFSEVLHNTIKKKRKRLLLMMIQKKSKKFKIKRDNLLKNKELTIIES